MAGKGNEYIVFGIRSADDTVCYTYHHISSGIPAIRDIGPTDFLFGKVWASAAKPSYGRDILGLNVIIILHPKPCFNFFT